MTMRKENPKAFLLLGLKTALVDFSNSSPSPQTFESLLSWAGILRPEGLVYSYGRVNN